MIYFVKNGPSFKLLMCSGTQTVIFLTIVILDILSYFYPLFITFIAFLLYAVLA